MFEFLKHNSHQISTNVHSGHARIKFNELIDKFDMYNDSETNFQKSN